MVYLISTLMATSLMVSLVQITGFPEDASLYQSSDGGCGPVGIALIVFLTPIVHQHTEQTLTVHGQEFIVVGYACERACPPVYSALFTVFSCS